MFRSSSEDINGLRKRFILIATGAAALLVAFVLVSLNAANYARVLNSLHYTLEALVRYDGRLPTYVELEAEAAAGSADSATTTASTPAPSSEGTSHSDQAHGSGSGDQGGSSFDWFYSLSRLFGNTDFSQESADRVRYFSVLYDADGNVTSVDSSHTNLMDDNEAIQVAEVYCSDALLPEGSFRYEDSVYGYLRHYYDDGRMLVAAVNYTSEAQSTEILSLYSMAFGFAFVLFFLLIVTLLSRKVTEPYVKNLDSQRRFVTNASHELKTPVAIIQANTELLEMISGSNEETVAIKRQTTRLTNLINRLVALARLQETGTEKLEVVSFTNAVQEACDNFKVVVEHEGKTFSSDVQEDIDVKAESRALHELVNILVDNANKYCDDGGHVSVVLGRHSKIRTRAELVVSNSYAEGGGLDYSRFFERFYRQDESHASGDGQGSGKSGSGIGLSMASTIVSNFHGKIHASWDDGVISFVVTI